jgi:hypothetical protein
MKYLMLIICSFTFVSCENKENLIMDQKAFIPYRSAMSDLELQAFDSLALPDRAYIADCMTVKENNKQMLKFHTFSHCYRELVSFKTPSTTNGSSPGMLKTIGGAAIGYGVGKLLFGGKSK